MNVLNLVRGNIKTLAPYSSARDEFTGMDSEMLFLDANENPFATAVNRYPDPQQQSVKDLLAVQKNVSTNNILLGNGSDEVLDLLFRAFCEPNLDNIITLPPTYGMYNVLAHINAIEVKEIMLSSDFQPQVDKILNAADTQTKLLFLCSPNNPTGNSFNTFEMEVLLEKFTGIVVIDEAYIDFSEEQSWINKLETYPNLVITQTLSKAYGMAGIRLGMCYASQDIITVLNSLKPPYNVNQLTQLKALERLKNLPQVRAEIALIKAERTKLIAALKAVSFIKKIYPSAANFLLVKVDDATQRYTQLLANGIVVRNRTTQILCANCLRITVGTPEENSNLMNTLKTLS